jgi:hypothetical protein
VVWWNQVHFVVVYKIKKEPGVYVAGKLAPVQNSPSFRVKKSVGGEFLMANFHFIKK